MPRVLVGLLDGTSIELNVNGNDRICDVKAKIECIMGIYWEEQRLIFNGKELNNEFIVKDVGITNGSKLFCVQKISNPNTQIFVKTFKGDTITMSVNPNNSIKDIALEIEKKMHVSCHNERLIFEGKSLQNNISLNEYNISNGNTIHLVSCLNGGDDEVQTVSVTDHLNVGQHESISFWDHIFASNFAIFSIIVILLLVGIMVGWYINDYKQKYGYKYSKLNITTTDTDRDTSVHESDASIPDMVVLKDDYDLP